MADFSFTYRAFISYAHADHKWAVWLHRALERYRVPRRLAGAEGLKRLGKCFRDEEELAAAAELGPKIEKALKSSDVLIVVCSPRSARSKWVNQEIVAFKREGREHRVFALIVEGEPHGPLDAVGNPTECFPDALKRTAAGGVAEPLAVDLRKFGREDAAVRLIAGMLDVGYDDLRQREVRRRRAELFRAQALFVSGLILIAAALTGGYFASANYVDASERTSRLFAREANTLVDEDRPSTAMLMALQGDPAAQAGLAEQWLRPAGYASARSSLVRAVMGNRLVETFDTQGKAVLSLAVYSDGVRFLTGSVDGKVHLWRIGDEKPLETFDAAGSVTSLVLYPDGERFLTGTAGGEVSLWRIGRDRPLETFNGGGPTRILSLAHPDSGPTIYSLALHPDGERFLAGRDDGLMQLWRVGEEKPLATYYNPSSFEVRSLAFLPDGKRFLAGSVEQVQLWNLGEDKPAAIMDGGRGTVDTLNGKVLSLVVLSDAERFLSGSEDGKARLWKIGEDKPLAVFDGEGRAVLSVALHPDGHRFLTGAEDGKVRLWQLGKDKPLAVFDAGSGRGLVWPLAFHPDGERFLAGYGDGKARLWRIGADKSPAAFVGAVGGVETLAVYPDGERFLTGTVEGTAQLWRLGSDKPLAAWKKDDLGGGIISLATHPDGARFLTGSDDGKVRLWRIGEDKPLAAFENVGQPVSSLALHPDGERFLAGYLGGDVLLWQIGHDEPLTLFPNGVGDISTLVFDPDGKRFLTGSDDGMVRLWSTAADKPQAQSDRNGGVYVSIAAEKPSAEFDGGGGSVYAIAFLADGERFLAGSNDGKVRLWRIGSDKPMAVFDSGSGVSVRSLALHADGEHFLAGYEDGEVRLWRLSEDKPLAVFDSADDIARPLVFLPDGKRFLTGSDHGEVWLRTIPDITNIAAAKQARTACATLKEIGVLDFSPEDYLRFPLLDRNAPHPCAKIWGFDPRQRHELNAKTAGR